MSRPEHQAPPELFYNDTEARKYADNTRIIEIQTTMSERAVELLCLPEGQPALVLDIGCGSGLSGEVLTDEGHYWVGLDISRSMLDVAQEKEVEGDLIEKDMGEGVGFRSGCFDGAISISAVQWLCNADKKDNVPVKRLKVFFSSLYKCLRRGARAVLQFYPENARQMELITSQAMAVGFSGGLVVDFPNSSKAKKYFLVLFAGMPEEGMQMPKGKTEGGSDDEANEVEYEGRQSKKRRFNDDKIKKGSKSWIHKKKDRYRAQGKDVKNDSKYTGRKRARW